MARSMGVLIVEKVDADLWELQEDLFFQYDNIIVDVPEGFKTDFASVPRLPIVYFLAGNTAHRPAVIHDYLYAMGTTTRAQADKIFRLAMKVTGVPAWRSWVMWAAVRFGGGDIWDYYREV